MHCTKCGAANADNATVCVACASPLTPLPAAAPAATAWSGATAPAARPLGITILAVLAFIGAGLFLLGALVMFLGGAFLSAVFASMFDMDAGAWAAIGVAIGIFLLLLAALYGVTGWAFWTGKPWGWIIGLVLAGLSIASGATTLMAGDFSAIITIAIAGFVIWYLMQPDAKRWFGRA